LRHHGLEQLDCSGQRSSLCCAWWSAMICSVQGGKRELVLGVDDELLKSKTRRIPRADVAELSVQSLVLPEADNRYLHSAPSSSTTCSLMSGLPTPQHLLRAMAGCCCKLCCAASVETEAPFQGNDDEGQLCEVQVNRCHFKGAIGWHSNGGFRQPPGGLKRQLQVQRSEGNCQRLRYACARCPKWHLPVLQCSPHCGAYSPDVCLAPHSPALTNTITLIIVL
jgi:hypothetical protein